MIGLLVTQCALPRLAIQRHMHMLLPSGLPQQATRLLSTPLCRPDAHQRPRQYVIDLLSIQRTQDITCSLAWRKRDLACTRRHPQ